MTGHNHLYAARTVSDETSAEPDFLSGSALQHVKKVAKPLF
jgi:hypothetical protein